MPTHPMRVLIAGGGVAALEAVLALQALAGERVHIDLLAPGTEFQPRPSSVLCPFGADPAAPIPFDLSQIAHHRGALAEVDPDRGEVRTTDGGRLSYDRLLIATGARAVEGVHGATLFRGAASAGAVEGALRGARRRVIFTVPDETGWTLPAYELALLAAQERRHGPELMVVSAELRPLELFGSVASDAVARLLHRNEVGFLGQTAASAVLGDALLTRDGRLLTADVVIALPRIEPREIPRLPAGFLAIDDHARVAGVPHVFAAGDVTSGPVKHGGLAAQQADAAAEQIAADAGAPVDPRPYRPVLRGLLYTGDGPLYMRKDLDVGDALARPLRYAPPQTSRAPLWWPQEKIVGRYLTGYLSRAATHR